MRSRGTLTAEEKEFVLYGLIFSGGIAIMLMIPANLSPYYAEPHAMWYRFVSSLAAPMFIFLSAGMVILIHKSTTLAIISRVAPR